MSFLFSEREQIQELIDKATAEPIDPIEVLHRYETNIGEYKLWLGNYTIDISSLLRVTFTHEKQPVGLCRHIAISVLKPECLPHPTVVIELCIEFGMGDLQMIEKINDSAIVKIWVENFDNGFKSVNILQLITSKVYH